MISPETGIKGITPIETGGRSPASDIVEWDRPPSQDPDRYRLVSLFAPAPHLNVEWFLQGSYGQERFYWSEPSSKEEPMTLAGLGIAAEVSIPPVLDSGIGKPALLTHRFESIAQEANDLFERSTLLPAEWVGNYSPVEDLIDHLARPRFFGGFAFQEDFVPDNTWSVFRPAQFILPHYQFVQLGDRAFLTINALVSGDEDFSSCYRGLSEALLARMSLILSPDDGSNSLADVHYPMTAGQWAEMIDRATRSIRTGELDKVVLARVCEVRTEKPIDATATLEYLQQNYGDCYRFIFEPVAHHAFFGATPELLARKTGADITTMALAGSIARGQCPDEDAALGRRLLSSVKNRHEHQLVVDTIKGNLLSSVTDLDIPGDPGLLRLKNIQHLLTPINGRLRDPATSVLSLVGQLHPTPAMGGVPAGVALTRLKEVEPVPRGWYAAPIGWFDAQHDGEFAVAIRSAVTQHARAWLYAGAGIVGDSDADQEWNETALKFRPMLGALGIEGNIVWN